MPPISEHLKVDCFQIRWRDLYFAGVELYIKRVPNVAGSLFEIIFEKPPSPYQILDAPCAEKFARPRAYGHSGVQL